MNGYVSKSQFATIYGCSKAYVSQLVKASRVVLSEDGQQVNVDASLRLLNVTADPSKAGVRERWQAFREGREFAGVASDRTPASVGAVAAPLADAAPAAQPAAGDQLRLDAQPESKGAGDQQPAPTNRYHDARTEREQAQAKLAQLELARAMGKVLEADLTLRAVMDAHIAARNEVMMLRDRLTQVVAPITDPRRVYDIITAECERICAQMQRRCQELAATHQAEVHA
jgi:phage terminase Nu1 subunit (DNA packaging protein)